MDCKIFLNALSNSKIELLHFLQLFKMKAVARLDATSHKNYI